MTWMTLQSKTFMSIASSVRSFQFPWCNGALLLSVVVSIGCQPSVEPPPELPPLESPIPGPPPAPPKPVVESSEIEVLSEDGRVLERLSTETPFRGRLEFQVGEDSPAVSRVVLRFGRYDADGVFTTASEYLGSATQDEGGLYAVEVPLRSPNIEGTFHVRAEMDGFVVAEREIEVVAE